MEGSGSVQIMKAQKHRYGSCGSGSTTLIRTTHCYREGCRFLSYCTSVSKRAFYRSHQCWSFYVYQLILLQFFRPYYPVTHSSYLLVKFRVDICELTSIEVDDKGLFELRRSKNICLSLRVDELFFALRIHSLFAMIDLIFPSVTHSFSYSFI